MKNTITKMVKVGESKATLKVVLEMNLTEEGRFTCMGEIHFRGSYIGGQCLDDMQRIMADNGLKCEKLNALVPLWNRWHNNDMRAGSPRQMEVLNARVANGQAVDYETMCEVLERMGLYADEEFIYNGKPYVYGQAWLKEEIPAAVVAEIRKVMDMPLTITEKVA